MRGGATRVLSKNSFFQWLRFSHFVLTLSLFLAHFSIATTAQAASKTPSDSGVLTVVSIAKQRMAVYGPQGLLAESPVSTGMRGHETPTGVFTILQRNRHHRSNLYDNAPMPYMQRLTWSGIALHAGLLPGYPASHGCIRMPEAFAAKMWDTTALGARVLVVPDDELPREVVHARLPQPTLFPMLSGPGQPVRTAAVESEGVSDASLSVEGPRFLNPLQRASAMKELLASEAAQSRRDAKALAERASRLGRLANRAAFNARLKERQIHGWIARISYLERLLARRNSVAFAARLQKQKFDAEQRLGILRIETSAATEAAHLAADEALEAASIALDAEWKRDGAVAAASSAEKAAAGHAISIFVSRKTGRVQVRQGWETILDAPVTFKGPPSPLGTHVFVALAPEEGGRSMRWASLSFKGSGEARNGVQKRTGRPSRPPLPLPALETAESILDKFEIGPESARFISERLWTGATLIVSDQAASHETGKHTDFIILAK